MKRPGCISPIRFHVAILLLACCARPTVGQETAADSRVGKKIIVTTAGAEFKTPKATVWRAYAGQVFTLSMVNNEWLWSQEKGGWMWEKDGVLFDKAISVTSDRLAKSPTAEAYHVRGVVFVAHEKYERALSDFSSSLEKSPRNAGVLNNRGQCHYLLEDYPAAIEDFRKAIKLDSKHFVAFNNRALAQIELENYSAALADLQKALQLNPKYPEALLNRGVVYEDTGKSKAAIVDYTSAIKIDSKYAAAYGNRAFSYRSLGQYSDAITDLRKAIELAPKSFEAVNDLAFTLATAKDEKIRNGSEAIVLAEQANSMTDEEHWNALDTLAVARAAINDFEGAAKAVTRAIELAPETEQANLKVHQELIAAKLPVLE